MDFKGRFPPAPACSSCVAQAAPGLPAPSPPRARPTQRVLLAEVLVLSLVQGLLVEFHFRLQYRLVFRCVPCLLCWGGGFEHPQSSHSCFLFCSPAHPSHYLPLPSSRNPLSPTPLPLDTFLA